MLTATKTAELIDDHCNGDPYIDGDYVYFQGGTWPQLWRRKKDGSDDAVMLDSYCWARPLTHRDFVYFSGGAGTGAIQQLYAKYKEGGSEIEEIDHNAFGRPWMHNDHIYFRAWGGIWKRDALEPKKNSVQVVHACDKDFMIFDNYIYFNSGGRLYKAHCDGSDKDKPFHLANSSRLPAIVDGNLYYIVWGQIYIGSVNTFNEPGESYLALATDDLIYNQATGRLFYTNRTKLQSVLPNNANTVITYDEHCYGQPWVDNDSGYIYFRGGAGLSFAQKGLYRIKI